jgi:hypothetical protein
MRVRTLHTVEGAVEGLTIRGDRAELEAALERLHELLIAADPRGVTPAHELVVRARGVLTGRHEWMAELLERVMDPNPIAAALKPMHPCVPDCRCDDCAAYRAAKARGAAAAPAAPEAEPVLRCASRNCSRNGEPYVDHFGDGELYCGGTDVATGELHLDAGDGVVS